MAERDQRDCVELGAEGRLIRLQLEELVGDVPAERDAIVRDYHAAGAAPEATIALEGLRALRVPASCSSSTGSPSCSATTAAVNPLDHSVAPRGYRVLSHIPRLPEAVVQRVVDDFGGLEAVVRASQRDLEAVEGVGAVRAREIREGLRRLQEHNLVDRYLQLVRDSGALETAAKIAALFQPISASLGCTGPAPYARRLFWRKRAIEKGRSACTRSATRWCIRTTVPGRSSRRSPARCSGRSAST